MNAATPTVNGESLSGPKYSAAICPDAKNDDIMPIKRSALWRRVESFSSDVVIVVLAAVSAAWALRGDLILALSVLCLSAIAVVTIGLMALKIAASANNSQPSKDSAVSMSGAPVKLMEMQIGCLLGHFNGMASPLTLLQVMA